MSSGQIIARHYDTGQPIELTWENGRITAILPVQVSSNPETWIAPPLLDIQVNGYAGIDFQQDQLTIDDLRTAVRGLRRDGCTCFFLTLITEAWPRLLQRLAHLVELRHRDRELQDAMVGWHIEGPFLSPKPGFHGAHDPAVMMDPLPEHIDALRELTGDQPLLLTIAPERTGAEATVAYARSQGILVHFGHSDAPLETLRALSNDQSSFTHLGNACPQQLDRHDNILWRVLDVPDLCCSLIPDGIHVSPALFRLVHRVKGDKVFYTTDAMSAAGAPPGRYPLGRLELEVGSDGVVRQPGQTNFAGSSCTPIQGVLRAASMMNEPWQKAWKRFSEIPGHVVSWDMTLREGAPASFCLASRPSSASVTDPFAWTFQTYYLGQPWAALRQS